MRDLLPIGSVVLLNDSNKRLFIYGRWIKNPEQNRSYDYVGCYYPEGSLDNKSNFLFDHEQIQRIYAIGFQDEEEFEFKKALENIESKTNP